MTSPDVSKTAQALGGAFINALQGPAQLAATVATAFLAKPRGGCEIPPPCWEPQPAGTCRIAAIPGGTATIRIRVSNCGWSRQVVLITALGKVAGWMTFAPTTAVLGPQEDTTLFVTIRIPDKLQSGQRFTAPIIVRGCRDHFVRVEIVVGDCAPQCVCDVAINDCADHVHHWYEHFYCPRPCRTGRDPGNEDRDG